MDLTNKQLDDLVRAPWAFSSEHLADVITALRKPNMSEHEPYVSAKDYRDLAAEVNQLTIERDDWRERAGIAGIRREREEMLHKEAMVAFKVKVKELVSATGDDIANALEQMLKGNWVDDQGHDVKMNAQMIRLKETLGALGKFRADHLGYAPFDTKDVTGVPV